MADKLYKTYRAEIKGVNTTDGTLDMFIPVSTGSIDRDSEVITPSAFRKTLPKFMEHPALVASHDYRDLKNLIGEWTKLKITETGVEGKPKYYINAGNEQADWGFYLASKGMAAFSVGFIPNPEAITEGDGVNTPRRTYGDIELLEISQVIIPSNREAIQNIRSKSVDPTITKLCDDVLEDKELVTKPEETDEYIRLPVKGEEGKHSGHEIRTRNIDEGKGISALYCIQCKTIITYLFAKEKGWTMEKAREWMREHGKSIDWDAEIAEFWAKYPDGIDMPFDSFEKYCPNCAAVMKWADPTIVDSKIKLSKQMPEHLLEGLCNAIGSDPGFFTSCMNFDFGSFAPGDKESFCAWLHHECVGIWPGEKESVVEPPRRKSFSQEEILDELDYLIRLIGTGGMNDDVKKDIWRLVEETLRLAGDDIPDNIVVMVLKSAKLERLIPKAGEIPEPRRKSSDTVLLRSIRRIRERKL